MVGTVHELAGAIQNPTGIIQETSWATPTTMNEILQRIYAN
jgi:hypothetical protein